MNETSKTNSVRRGGEPRPRKAYEKPGLVRYGSLRAMTAGASGSSNENAAPGRPDNKPSVKSKPS
jgi:hypothetical protein